jgi:hypothetical protein
VEARYRLTRAYFVLRGIIIVSNYFFHRLPNKPKPLVLLFFAVFCCCFLLLLLVVASCCWFLVVASRNKEDIL